MRKITYTHIHMNLCAQLEIYIHISFPSHNSARAGLVLQATLDCLSLWEGGTAAACRGDRRGEDERRRRRTTDNDGRRTTNDDFSNLCYGFIVFN